MRMPSALTSLDDKVLGRRRRERSEQGEEHEPYPDEARGERRQVVERTPATSGGTGDGLREFLSVFGRISKLVLLSLAALLVLGIVFVLAPTNPDNAIVELVADVSNAVAGPFRDIFAISDNADRETVVNYGFAAVVYAVLGSLVGKLGSSAD